MTQEVPLDALLLVYRDGDETGWEAEFRKLWSHPSGYMEMLAASIQEEGIRKPILLGTDGRVWDGHHRLAAAHRLGIAKVPVEFAGQRTDPGSELVTTSEVRHCVQADRWGFMSAATFDRWLEAHDREVARR